MKRAMSLSLYTLPLQPKQKEVIIFLWVESNKNRDANVDMKRLAVLYQQDVNGIGKDKLNYKLPLA